MPLHFKWSAQNKKLKKDNITSFGIPALQDAHGFTTCPNARACASICYARQGNYQFPNVKRTRQHNIDLVRQLLNQHPGALTRALIDDISKLSQYQYIRIHDSGDFFSSAYLDAWCDALREHPDIRAYAYTKMIGRTIHRYQRGRIPPNLNIIQSFGGSQDYMISLRHPHAIIVPTESDIPPGYIDGSHSDLPAARGYGQIALVYHGSRRLTPGQTDTLTQIVTDHIHAS